MDRIQQLAEWYAANAAWITVVIVHLFLAGRIIAKYTKNKTDDTIVALIHKVASFFGIVIPDDDVETIVDKAETVELARARPFRDALRRFIRGRTTVVDGIDDATLDYQIDKWAEGEGMIVGSGFLVWLLANPDKVVALIQFLIAIFGRQSQAAFPDASGAMNAGMLAHRDMHSAPKGGV
jgi:hypothetical protein